MQLSLQTFGENVSSPIQNNDGTQLHADACYPINFDLFGATIDLRVAALIYGDVNTIAAGKVVLLASAAPDSVGGTVLAELDPPITGTGGNFVVMRWTGTITNPGGTKYLVIASQAGVGF